MTIRQKFCVILTVTNAHAERVDEEEKAEE